MGNSSKKSYEEQLSSFASELRNHIDDESMLQEIHLAIKSMLAGDGVSEKEVRDTLQQQHENGELREESFQLMRQLIDSIVSEDLPTATIVLPTDDTDNPPAATIVLSTDDTEGPPTTTAVLPTDQNDPFGSTTVIPTVTLSPALADEQLQVGSVLRDRFMLTEEVQGGSMGTVYKALDRRLAEAGEEEHWVAIKVLSPKLSYDADALRALQQEAVKTRCLSHPNIVRFIDLDRDDNLYFMVMEWLDGRSLANILDDSSANQMDVEAALDITRQIGNALDYAHLRGVIHADVKPGNVMIMPSGQAKLFDFGIARIRQKQSDSKAEVDPGTLKAATPAYSSMQVLTGEEPVAADDVFSLACLAYRLIAGYRVFGPRNAAEAAAAGMKPQRLESLSKSQWNALKKALAYSRVARYSSPSDFVKALTAMTKTVDAPLEIEFDRDNRYIEEFDTSPRKLWRYIVILLIFAGGVAVVFQDDLVPLVRPYVDDTLDRLSETPGDAEDELQAEPVDQSQIEVAQDTRTLELADVPVASEAISDLHAEELDAAVTEIPVPAEAPLDAEPETPVAAVESFEAEPAAVDIAIPAGPDLSSLPPANIILPLAGPGEPPETSSIALMEGGPSVIIDFVRASNLDEAWQLKLQEHTRNAKQSALEAGQYSLSNDGILDFMPGQHRARLTISMTPDTVREADHYIALVVLDTEYGDKVFASVGLSLQDDDQRAYESRLAPNTVAFAVDVLAVRESDAAIQMDVIRYKADNSSQVVNYVIRDVTTTEGEDYIAPFSGSLSFGPGERSERILIPLIQDSVRETDETFTIELLGDFPYTEGNIYRRITVMIRDDDS